ASINKPPLFDGTPSKLEDFIVHVKMNIFNDSARYSTEISKIIFLCSFLTGFAFSWARPYLE
ncbi:uncharacterized protein BYT42DRAFT_469467, partial [Radiomyces spectabilis]|uniref:uncharacterized protein n=1 Tax=Radiomyces spectabilis TaxID=64574 RepID=UPI00221F7D13